VRRRRWTRRLARGEARGGGTRGGADQLIIGTAAPARAGMCRYRLVMGDRKRRSLLDN